MGFGRLDLAFRISLEAFLQAWHRFEDLVFVQFESV